MFDTARLDRAGSIGASDPDPMAELGWRAVAVGLQTASLDEVLCIAATRPVQQPKPTARVAKKAAKKAPARTVQQPIATPVVAKKAAARPVGQTKATARVARKGRRPKTPPQ